MCIKLQDGWQTIRRHYIYLANDLGVGSLCVQIFQLALVLLNQIYAAFANCVGPDQLASGSALFVIKYANSYQPSGSSNLIG